MAPDPSNTKISRRMSRGVKLSRPSKLYMQNPPSILAPTSPDTVHQLSVTMAPFDEDVRSFAP